MDLAEGERLMTRETVAGERPRCSASAFRLTACGGRSERRIEAAPGFERGIGVDRYAVTHNVDRCAVTHYFVRVVSHKARPRARAEGDFRRQKNLLDKSLRAGIECNADAG